MTTDSPGLSYTFQYLARPVEFFYNHPSTNQSLTCEPAAGQKTYLSSSMKRLSHMDKTGRVKMVDTSAKASTARRAIAQARVVMSPATVEAVRGHRTPKGDPLETARLAGIMAAKRTAGLIPLCHPLPLTYIDVRAEVVDDGVVIEAEVATEAQTGVEMEALTAATVAALTVYDMCKAVDKAMTITDVRLELKTGGKSGDYERQKAKGKRKI